MPRPHKKNTDYISNIYIHIWLELNNSQHHENVRSTLDGFGKHPLKLINDSPKFPNMCFCTADHMPEAAYAKASL